MRSESPNVLDSSRVVDQSYMCGARFSLICDPKLDQMLKDRASINHRLQELLDSGRARPLDVATREHLHRQGTLTFDALDR